MKNEILLRVNALNSSDQTLRLPEQSEAFKLCVSNYEQHSLVMHNLAARKFQ